MKKFLKYYIYSASFISLVIFILFFLLPDVFKINLFEIASNLSYDDYMRIEDTFMALFFLNAPLLLIISLLVLISPKLKDIRASLLGFFVVLLVVCVVIYFSYLIV